jgi:hypothetical protein
MLKKWFLILLILHFSKISFSQKEISDPETISYNWYLQANWDSLLHNRSKLLTKETDYYYIRYRLGEAAYRKGKYRQAATDFGKASSFNSGDSFSTKYFASSLLLSGRISEAILNRKKLEKQKSFSSSYYKQSQLNNFYIEAGKKFSSDTTISGNLSYFQLATGLQILRSANVFVAFSYLNNSNYYSNVAQKVYYSKLKLQFKKAWSLEPYYSFIDATIAYKPTIYYPYVFNYYLQNQVVGLNVLKSFSKWDISFGGTYSNLSNNIQTQANAGFSFYPKANNTMFAGLQLTYHNENNGSTSSQNILIKPSIGIKVTSNLWFTSEFYYGKAYNFIENSGYLINNSVDLTRWRVNSGFQWYPNRKISVLVTYLHEARTERNLNNLYSLNSIFVGIRYSPWSR